MTREEILGAVKAGVMTIEEATAELNRKDEKALSCKVSKKGGVSVYGLQRMPVTLYGGQWARLIDYIGQVQEFIDSHKSELATKDNPRVADDDDDADDDKTPATPAKLPTAKKVFQNMTGKQAG